MRFTIPILFVSTLLAGVSQAYAEEPPSLIVEWGGQGSGPGEFTRAVAIAVDLQGNVYVTQDRNDRLQKFDNDGNYVGEWDLGNGPGRGTTVGGLTVDPRGNVFACVSGRIWRYDRNGNFVLKWVAPCYGIAADTDGHIYAVANRSLFKYTNTGELLGEWGDFNSPLFAEPSGVAVDGDGHVYVSDRFGYHALQKFDADGNLLWRLPHTQSFYPVGVSATSDGTIYSASEEGVRKYRSDGTLLWEIPSNLDEDGYQPWDVALDQNGNLFVVEDLRVQKYGAATVPVKPATWGRIKAKYGLAP